MQTVYPHPRAVTPPANSNGHTVRDWLELVAADVDPATTQPREWQTRCWCFAETWHQSATCDEHYVAPRAAVKAVAR